MHYGELLSHAFLVNRENAIKCAAAIMLYVSHHGRIRDRLASNIAEALLCLFHQSFHVQKIVESVYNPLPLSAPAAVVVGQSDEEKEGGGIDFLCEANDTPIIGRLYHLAIIASSPYLNKVGLLWDHLGFTVALC